MSKKDKALIQELQEELDFIYEEHDALTREYNAVYRELYYPDVERKDTQLWNRIKKLIRNPRHAASVSIDLWPISDWFRLKYTSYRPGQYAQLTIGPIRIDFYAS